MPNLSQFWREESWIGEMLAKPIGSHYDLRVRAIAVRLPLMP
ncbi:hypothetical protein [Coleofasciculus sp. G3-WIS-01]